VLNLSLWSVGDTRINAFPALME